MRLCDINPDKSLTKKVKRVGRGNSSGHGTTSGRGSKGQLSRSGGNVRPGFEGGQMPLHRRIPHLPGFKNTRKKEYNIINVGTLEKLDGSGVIDFNFLLKKGCIREEKNQLKILGSGELTKSLTVRADFFSAGAVKKIEAAGGKIEIIQAGK